MKQRKILCRFLTFYVRNAEKQAKYWSRRPINLPHVQHVEVQNWQSCFPPLLPYRESPDRNFPGRVIRPAAAVLQALPAVAGPALAVGKIPGKLRPDYFEGEDD